MNIKDTADIGFNLTDCFLDRLYELSQDTFHESVIHQTKRCILDYIGVTLAGAKSIEMNSNNSISNLCDEYGDISVIGTEHKTNLQSAVFINGISAHFLELDDGVRFGAIHPGAPIISALLPYAQKYKLSGMDLIRGIIIGYEASIRLASAIQPSHYNKGYHPTATCGSIGAAISIAVADKFTKEQMKAAFSSAVITSGGTLKVLDDESQLKAFNVGQASVNGLLSTYMAKIGLLVPKDVLSGNIGFLEMMSDNFDNTKLLISKEEPYKILKVYFKLYAACRHCHSSIEAAFNIRRNNQLLLEEIKEIKIDTYEYVIGRHDHTKIQGTSSAKMSIPYSTVIALLFGKATDKEFSSNMILEPEIHFLLEKVKICENEELSALVPQMRPAILTITKKDNTKYTERINFPKGEPENPLTDQELIDKFVSLARYANKTDKEINKIIDCVMNLENRLEELYSLL
jgi:2-methylcitrate dehydratase PrpD